MQTFVLKHTDASSTVTLADSKLRTHANAARIPALSPKEARMMRPPSFVLLGLAALPLSRADAQTSPGSTLLFNRAGFAASNVPGTPGVLFSSFLDGFTASQDGSRWAIRANASGAPGTRDTFFVTGDQSGITTLIPENDTLPGLGLGWFDTSSERTIFINDQGDLAMSGRFGPASTSTDDMVVRYTAATNTYAIVAREGDLIPGLGGERYGFTNDAAAIDNQGRVYFRDGGTSGSIPSDQDEFIFRADGASIAPYLQIGTFAPGNQLGGTNAPLSGLTLRTFHASDDGSKYITRGNLDVPSNGSVIVVNGRVRLQSGAPVDGVGGVAISTIASSDNMGMNSRGDWFVWSSTTTLETYLMVNDEVVLTNSTPLPSGLSGSFGSIEDVGLNGNGDLVIASRIASTGQYVITIDPRGETGPYVVLTSGSTSPFAQGIDLNGDGLLNENAFLSTISDVSLGNNGELLVVGRVADSVTGLNIGDGLYRFQVQIIPAPGTLAMLAIAPALMRRRRTDAKPLGT